MKLYYTLPQSSDHIFSLAKTSKIQYGLIKHTYIQASTTLFASFICAVVLFIGLHKSGSDNSALFYWSSLIIPVTVGRLAIVQQYRNLGYPEQDYLYWRNIYILGSILGGLTWGFAGIFLLPPEPTAAGQILLIMMLAGVTAGAAPVSAGIPSAAIGFLVGSLIPYMVSIATFLPGKTYAAFNLTVFLYFVYLIVLTFRTYHLVKNSLILRHENDILLNNLSLANEKLEYAATHDPLTAVPNRRLFVQTLEETVQEAKVSKKLFALLYIDLDRFKEANDKYGHQVGDEVLVIVFNRLKSYFERDDNIARMGGDELAIILDQVKDREEIESVAKDICELLAIPIEINDIKIYISASIGISIYPYDGVDEETLLQTSDKYMYYAKRRGGNNFYVTRTKESVT